MLRLGHQLHISILWILCDYSMKNNLSHVMYNNNCPEAITVADLGAGARGHWPPPLQKTQ